MAVVGLRYGYDVVNSLMGSGLQLAIVAIFVEAIAVLIAFIIGHKVFKINWIILSGAIAGGCTSAPGLGAAIRGTHRRLRRSTAFCDSGKCFARHIVL